MKMRLLAAIAIVLGTGCTSFSVFDEKLPAYSGRPIEDLVARLGYPNAEQTVMGRKAYIWNTSQQFTSITPTTSTTTGYVGTRSVNMQTTTYSTDTSTLSCVIRVFVDDQNRITRWEYNGNNGACYKYSGRL
jgi:hypothetical protein